MNIERDATHCKRWPGCGGSSLCMACSMLEPEIEDEPPRWITPDVEYAIDAARRAYMPALQAAEKTGRLSAVVSYHEDGRPNVSVGLWRDCTLDYVRRLTEGKANGWRFGLDTTYGPQVPPA